MVPRCRTVGDTCWQQYMLGPVLGQPCRMLPAGSASRPRPIRTPMGHRRPICLCAAGHLLPPLPHVRTAWDAPATQRSRDCSHTSFCHPFRTLFIPRLPVRLESEPGLGTGNGTQRAQSQTDEDAENSLRVPLRALCALCALCVEAAGPLPGRGYAQTPNARPDH